MQGNYKVETNRSPSGLVSCYQALTLPAHEYEAPQVHLTQPQEMTSMGVSLSLRVCILDVPICLAVD